MRFWAGLSLGRLRFFMRTDPHVTKAAEQSPVATQALLTALSVTLKGVLAAGGPIKAP